MKEPLRIFLARRIHTMDESLPLATSLTATMRCLVRLPLSSLHRRLRQCPLSASRRMIAAIRGVIPACSSEGLAAFSREKPRVIQCCDATSFSGRADRP